MDLTVNPLLGSYLNFGQFEAFNTRLSLNRYKSVINRWIKIIIFINAFKLVIIVLSSWCGFSDMKFYLIDMYLISGDFGKFLDTGIAVVYIGLFTGFSYWTSLSEKKASLLENFSFLLILDTNDRYRYGQRCGLDKKSTDKLLRTYRIVNRLLWLSMVCYFSFESSMIQRCFYHSFHRVDLVYFLSFGLLFWLITCAAYSAIVIYVASMFFLVIITTEYLILRLKAAHKLVSRKLILTKLASTSKPVKISEQTALKIQIALNGLCQQFREINSVIDSSVSLFMLGIFICVFVSPYFLIFVVTFKIRLFLSVLMMGVYCWCNSFAFCNDRLTKQVG